MRRLDRRSLVVVSFAVTLSSPLRAPGQEPKTQSWVGGIAAGGFIGIALNISQGATPSATLDFINQGPERQKLPIDRFVLEGSRIYAEWTEPDGTASIEGSQKIVAGETVMEGVFTQGEQKGKFYLARGERISRTMIARDYGLFASSTNDLIWLGPMSELNRRPAYVHIGSGQFGAIYPRRADEYFSGRTALIPYPSEIVANVSERDSSGRAKRIVWKRGTQSARIALRKDVYITESVVFKNDTVRLAGTVITPKGKGPFPAVVFIHGSGGSTREYFSSLPYLLAARGIASLIYDKRGSGESTGNRHISPFESLADDALAGVRLLQSRPTINAKRIGLYGHSQGGWVAPLAAKRSNGAVSFVVAIAGPAQDFQRQTNDEIASELRELPLGEEAIGKALAYQDLWWQVYRRQASYAQLAVLTSSSKSEPWYRYTFGLKPEAEFVLDPPGAYDPATVLQHLTVPILAIYGERDNRVLGRKNAELMRSALRLARNSDATVKVFADADHDMIIVRGKGAEDYLDRSRYADGYLDYVVGWIARHATHSAR